MLAIHAVSVRHSRQASSPPRAEPSPLEARSSRPPMGSSNSKKKTEGGSRVYKKGKPSQRAATVDWRGDSSVEARAGVWEIVEFSLLLWDWEFICVSCFELLLSACKRGFVWGAYPCDRRVNCVTLCKLWGSVIDVLLLLIDVIICDNLCACLLLILLNSLIGWRVRRISKLIWKLLFKFFSGTSLCGFPGKRRQKPIFFSLPHSENRGWGADNSDSESLTFF